MTSSRIRSGGGVALASCKALAPLVATRTLYVSFRMEFTIWMFAGASSTTRTILLSSVSMSVLSPVQIEFSRELLQLRHCRVEFEVIESHAELFDQWLL